MKIFSRRALTPLCLCAPLLCSALIAQSAPQKGATKAPAKKAPAKKTPAPPKATGTRVMPKGTGAMQLDGTFTNRGANLLGNSYSALMFGKYKDIQSTGTAAFENGIGVVVLLTGTLPSGEKEDALRVAYQMGGAFSSKAGFYAGQKIPIALPAPDPSKISSQSFLQLSQTEIKKAERPSGYAKTRSSSWVAKSGTLEVTSVSSRRVSFTIKNALFTVQNPRQEGNFAVGSLVFNGKGSMNIPVDDGFR